MKKILFVGLAFMLAISSCKEDTKYSWEIDEEDIQEYLAKTGIDATKHEYGFYYVIDETGDGQTPSVNNNIEVRTLGYTLDSVIRQSDINPVILAPLSSAVTGWQYGIPLFKEGGKGMLILPRSFGYGTEVLIFEVEILKVW